MYAGVSSVKFFNVYFTLHILRLEILIFKEQKTFLVSAYFTFIQFHFGLI